MARNRKHLGLSYLEELNMIKESETLCKESRRDLPQFKQSLATAHTNAHTPPSLEDLTPDQSPQPECYPLQRSKSPHKLVMNTNKNIPNEFIGSSEVHGEVKLSCEVRGMKKQTRDLRMMTQRNKSPPIEDSTDKKQGSCCEKINMENSSTCTKTTSEKMPVIASLAGTAKQITLFKQPVPPQKPSYNRIILRPRSLTNKPPILLQKDKDTRKVKDRIATLKINLQTIKTNSTEELIRGSYVSRESSCTDSDSSKQASKKKKVIGKEDLQGGGKVLKENQQSLVSEMGRAPSSSQPSVGSVPELLEEATDTTRPDASKIYEKNFQQSKPEEPTSTPKLPVKVAARSIDEIIASLQSTFQSPSDQMIKELLESVLGENYNIKIEQASVEPQGKKSESQTNEEILPSIQQPTLIPVIKKELPAEESESQAKELLTDFKQVKQIKESSIETFPDQAPGTLCLPAQDLPCFPQSEGSKLKLFSSSVPLLSKPTLPLLNILEEVKNEQELQKAGSSSSLSLLETVSSDVLQVKGKAVIKTKPVEVQQKLPDHQLQHPLSWLSTWTPKIKEQHYPVMHHLCTASPSFSLPIDLQLASRVYHTFSRRGHDILFTEEEPHHEEEKLFYSKHIFFEEQSERRRICYEGIPVLELFQENQEGGIHVLPPHTSESLTEWQKKAEYYVEKPRLELLGEKVSFYPETLKTFWAPAPPKFSAPLSFMKEMLFPKYKSNVIEGVIIEDFSSDHPEEDGLKSEEDSDIDSYMTKTIVRRCHSLPDFFSTEESKINLIKRSVSAPEMADFKEKTKLKMSANFKTSMKEMKVMKQQISELKVETESEKSFPTKHLLNKNYDEPQLVLTEMPVEKQPSLTRQGDSENDIVLAERAREAGIKYIVFPKRKKSKRSKKIIDSTKLKAVIQLLNQPPKNLESSVSLGSLHSHRKYCIKVPPSVRYYRSPSLPHLLDFEKFAESKGGIPEETGVREWVKEIWYSWFDETFPPSRSPSEEKGVNIQTETKKPDSGEETKPNLEIELVDSIKPFLVEDEAVNIEDLEAEISRLTLLIVKEGNSSGFHYCRRGAINRKLGKLKSAMEDLEKAIRLEPLLLNAYWHRHLIYLFQAKIPAALDDLNYIIKWNKKSVDAYLSKAEIYRRQGNNALAIINYTLAEKCNPTDDDIYFRRAELLENANELLLAMEDYTKCFRCNPKRTDALMKHGIHSFEKSALTVAIEDFTTVIKEDPNNAQARLYRGRAYATQQQYKNATEDFSAAIHLDPLNWLAFYYRGCMLRKIDPKRALQDFSVSVLLNDTFENLSSFFHRGILYAEQSCWSLAICDFEDVLVLDKGFSLAYINIGLILLWHLDHYYEAIRQFSNAIEVDPTNMRPYVCRAQAYHKVHDVQLALKDINRAIHLYPNESYLRITRGQYLLELKRYDLASFSIHQVAEMGEVSFKITPVQQALVDSFCQNHSKAIKCLLEVTENKPEPSVFVLLGKIQMKAKKTKEALESFKAALKLLASSAKPLPNTFETAEIYYFMGLCYMEQVNFLQACEAFSIAVKVYSVYPDAFYQRGLCRMQLKQTKCIQDFNRALAINPAHFQAYLSRAAYYGSKGRYSKAILNCNEAIRIHPKSVRAYLYRGTLKYHNKTYKNSIEDLTKAVDLDKTCILAYFNRAICYHHIKDFRKALKDYGILLLSESSKETVLKVLVNRGLLYMELEDYSNALEDFKEVTLGSPDDSTIYQVIGMCYNRLQQFEEAVKSFTQVLKIDPFSVDAYVGRGNSYMEYGHEAGHIQAQKDFLKALHLNPKCINARICLGYNLQVLGKFQKAWNQFTVVIGIDPKSHTAYDGRALVCLQMGDAFAAFQDTNAALKLTTTAQLLTNRGVINQFMGDLTCAMKDYQQAISINPDYALAYFNAANIYFHNRQFSQAYCYYSKALQLDPRNEAAVLNRAITNTLLQNTDEAKEDFEKAVSLCPFSASVYFNRANLYNMLRQYELAEKDISTALSIQPNDALMYKLRADIRGKMGFSKEAIADYKQAISIQELVNDT
ncbi:tetratricopeptide repeat protein 6 [Alligator sinensis]|uniref:Tetratricopeptide repeat protein 6 n=1 Tax=Alligator sinensis TaxID=38654 RepID=A0A3Q0GCP9_ALLSI|nr:tetratricopeptide repeat protein 6 [Alligator sinensis]